MGKNKTISVGTISGMEILKKSRPPQDITFRTGKYMTEEDRPRKKNWDYDPEFDFEDEFEEIEEELEL